jgi:thiol-disulfide isomerase/thioredoxin
MQIKKKHMVILGLIASTCIFFLSAVILYWKPHPDSSPEKAINIDKIDRLFYEMGIQKIPGVMPPLDILLNDVNGKRVRISDLKGNIVFLNFWATWCPGCLI